MYFNQFPKTEYNLKNDLTPGFQIVTNIFFRVKILDSIKGNIFAYVPYRIMEGERLDTLAEKFYGNSELDWLITLANDYTNPIHDWPKDNYTFNSYIIKKYGSLLGATTTPHHYERIIRRVNNARQTENTVTLEITQEDYEDFAGDSYTTYNLDNGDACEQTITQRMVTCYDWEVADNDKKREIKLIRRDYVPQILNEFNNLTKAAKGLPIGYRTLS